MNLSAGMRLGPYEITAPIGAGGMGEVYKALDTRLGRAVAIKVLPPSFALDPERRQRFQREARAVAALHHPNICTLHDIGQDVISAGSGPAPAPGSEQLVDYLVMEYLEGETLAQRLARGHSRRSGASQATSAAPSPAPSSPAEGATVSPPASIRPSTALPLELSLLVATELADALAAAHRAGIVHRDLKPANVMLAKTGGARQGSAQVKVLDFGLAKLTVPAMAPAPGAPTSATMETQTSPGIILGTLPYMAPEQLEARDVDHRADIFAFGAIVYEMLTGRRPFEGNSQASVIAAILEHEPEPLSSIQPLTPPALERVVARCLAKDPDQRWQSAQDLASELNWIAEGGARTLLPGMTRTSSPRAAVIIVAVSVFAALAGFIAGWSLAPRPSPPSALVTHVQIPVEPAEELPPRARSFTLSPDGRTLAFIGTNNKKTQLYLRQLDQPTATPLEGTANASQPAYSPDGRWIAFYTGGVYPGPMKKIPANGGPVQTICKLPEMPHGFAWLNDREIVWAPWMGPLMAVSADGGPSRTLTRLAAGEAGHRLPQVLAGGRAILYTARTKMLLSGSRVVIESPADKTRTVLLEDAADARFLPSGHLLFMRQGTLMAVAFNSKTLALAGSPFAVCSDVRQFAAAYNSGPVAGAGLFATSDSGSLVYVPGTLTPPLWELVWIDRAGNVTSDGDPMRNEIESIRISPEGSRLAMTTNDGIRDAGLWVLDLTRGTKTRIPHQGEPSSLAWSRDGEYLVFSSLLAGKTSIFKCRADGTGAEERLLEETDLLVSSVSLDGKTVALVSNSLDKTSIALVRLDRPQRVPEPYLQSAYIYEDAEFSPDGRWLLFDSNETGRREVYLRPFTGGSANLQISTGGGYAGSWKANGQELFYISSADQAGILWMMSVDLTPALPKVGMTRRLFPIPNDLLFGGIPIRSYDVSPDGRRFIALRRGLQPPTPPITYLHFVEHWFDHLKAPVPLQK
jgi:serine/threonine-protein kinase